MKCLSFASFSIPDEFKRIRQLENTTDHSTSSTSSSTSTFQKPWRLVINCIPRTKIQTQTDCVGKHYQARKSKFFPHRDSLTLDVPQGKEWESAYVGGQIQVVMPLFHRFKGPTIRNEQVRTRKHHTTQRRTLLHHQDSLKLLIEKCRLE